MKKTLLPYADTGYFSKAVIDYLNGAEALKPFYDYPPAQASFAKVIAERQNQVYQRDTLHDVLMKQYFKIFSEREVPAVRKHIDLLKNANTFTITTAHQPNLFLGPLYVIYKSVSAILIARRLQQDFPDKHFVPAFWLGSEDHDKEELNHIYLFGKKFTWNTAQQGAFGRMSTSSLRPWISEIKEKLGDSGAARELSQALDEAYVKEKTVAAATRRFLTFLFGDEGLVVVDGDDATLKQCFIPVLQKEINESFSYEAVTENNKRFTMNYDSQVTPREINLFYLDEGLRERIVREGDRFRVLNSSISFSRQEMEDLVKESPEKLSPNVILRPLYQETILPDLAVVGGGAEVTYWMQLRSLFDEVHLPFPIVFLRNSVLWIEQSITSKMNRLGIDDRNVFDPGNELINHFIEKHSGELVSLGKEIKSVNDAFDDALSRAIAIDQSMKGAFESERTRVIKSLEQLEDRLMKAAKRKDESSVNQIRSIKEKLFPEDHLQERHDNFMMICSRHGRQFINDLLDSLDPFERQFTILLEEE